jgi:hypothetical protein
MALVSALLVVVPGGRRPIARGNPAPVTEAHGGLVSLDRLPLPAESRRLGPERCVSPISSCGLNRHVEFPVDNFVD